MMSPETGFGASKEAVSEANVPGIPVWYESSQYNITSSNDVLIFTSSEAGPRSIDIADNQYTQAAYATALQAAMNADTTLTGSGTIAFEVTFDVITRKFTIEAGAGNTIAFTLSGSDGATVLGFTADASAAQSITSDSQTEGTGTITFDFTENDNGDTVEYAIYDNESGNYIDTAGVSSGVSETWATFADWDNGGADGRVTVVGLTNFTGYTFKVKAKRET